MAHYIFSFHLKRLSHFLSVHNRRGPCGQMKCFWLLAGVQWIWRKISFWWSAKVQSFHYTAFLINTRATFTVMHKMSWRFYTIKMEKTLILHVQQWTAHTCSHWSLYINKCLQLYNSSLVILSVKSHCVCKIIKHWKRCRR